MGHGHGLDVSNGAAQPDHTPPQATGQAGERGCVVVRSDDSYEGIQGLSLSAGISTATAGSRALCMHMVVIPPGSRGTPHLHNGHETTIWIASGEVEVWHGPELAGRTLLRTGDFLYIPPGTPHRSTPFSTGWPPCGPTCVTSTWANRRGRRSRARWG